MSRVSPVQRVGLVLVSLLILLVGFSFSLADHWSIDDDDLNFFLTGRAILHDDEIDGKFDEAIDTLRASGLRDSGIESIETRHLNLGNYILPSTLYASVAELAGAVGLAPRLFDYGRHVVFSIVLGYLSSFLIAAGFVMAALFLAEARLRCQATLALGAMLLALVTLDFSGYFKFGDDWSLDLAKAVVNPGADFGLFGFAPRSNFVLIAFAILILRLSNRYRLAYVALAMTALFHRQQSLLLLAMLVPVDLILRPEIFRRPSILIWPAAVASYVGITEPPWGLIGIADLIFGWLALVLLGAAYAPAIMTASVRSRQQQPNESGFDHLAEESEIQRLIKDERFVFLVLWLGALGLSLFARGLPFHDHSHLWKILPGQMLMILQPILVFTVVGWLGSFALDRYRVAYQTSSVARTTLRLSLIALFLLLCVGLVDNISRLATRVGEEASAMGRYDVMAPLGASTRVDNRDEARLYYAMLKSVDTGAPIFERWIAATRHPGLASAIALNDLDVLIRLIEQELVQDRPLRLVPPFGWPRSSFQTTPYVAALIWRSHDVATLIREEVEGVPAKAGPQVLCEAAAQENGEIIEILMKGRAPTILDRICPQYGIPPICLAARSGHGHMPLTLGRMGVNLSPEGGCDSEENSPLDLLVRENGNEDVIRIFHQFLQRDEANPARQKP